MKCSMFSLYPCHCPVRYYKILPLGKLSKEYMGSVLFFYNCSMNLQLSLTKSLFIKKKKNNDHPSFVIQLLPWVEL